MERVHKPPPGSLTQQLATDTWHTHELPTVKRESVEHLEFFHSAAWHVGYVRLLTGQYVTGSRRALRSQQRGASREPAGSQGV